MYVKDLDINVVDATERRILEAFNKNQKLPSVSLAAKILYVCAIC